MWHLNSWIRKPDAAEFSDQQLGPSVLTVTQTYKQYWEVELVAKTGKWTYVPWGSTNTSPAEYGPMLSTGSDAV